MKPFLLNLRHCVACCVSSSAFFEHDPIIHIVCRQIEHHFASSISCFGNHTTAKHFVVWCAIIEKGNGLPSMVEHAAMLQEQLTDSSCSECKLFESDFKSIWLLAARHREQFKTFCIGTLTVSKQKNHSNIGVTKSFFLNYKISFVVAVSHVH